MRSKEVWSSKKDSSLHLGFFLRKYSPFSSFCFKTLIYGHSVSRKEKNQVCFWYKDLQLHWSRISPGNISSDPSDTYQGTLVPVAWRYLSSAQNTSKIFTDSFCCGVLIFLFCSSSRFDLTILSLKKGWVWKVFLEWWFCLQRDQCTLNCTCASGNWSEETVVQVPEFCKILAKKLALIII